MKYYHLIAISIGLFFVQFSLQNLLQLAIPDFIRKIFFMIQFVLFVSYSSLMFLTFFDKRRKNRRLKRNVVTLPTEEKKAPHYLKAS